MPLKTRIAVSPCGTEYEEVYWEDEEPEIEEAPIPIELPIPVQLPDPATV